MVEHRKARTQRGNRWNLDSFSLFVFASAIAGFLLINYMFCPRYVLWKGLYLPEAWSNPEVNRAVDALRQLNDPFERIDNPTNDIIQWRLLFPLLGHYFKIPAVVYLAIPHIGCIVTLAWLTILNFTKIRSRLFAFLASVAFGTSSWFFVSSGWLAYFDSWYILGLIVAAFHPRRRWLVIACLLVPWIDERFVLALPLTMAVRAVYLEQPLSKPSKPLLAYLMAIIVSVVPWIAFRLYVVLVAEDQSSISATALPIAFVKPGGYWFILDGLWNGLRCLWFFPLAYFALLLSRRKIALATLLTVVSVVTIVLNLRFANDLSRSASNLLPLVVLGFFETFRCPPSQWRTWLCWVTALNLLLPTSHVVGTMKIPVFYFPYEQFRASNPPPEVSPTHYSNNGVRAWLTKDGNAAIEMFSVAIQLDANFAEGYLNRGIVHRDLGNLELAQIDIARAMEISPKLYEAQLEWARLLELQGDQSNAEKTLRTILNNTPDESQLRSSVEDMLRRLTSP